MCDYYFELAHKGKFICPACGKKTFVPYIDAEGNILSSTVGKCDRADKCGYHYPPKRYFAEHEDLRKIIYSKPITRAKLKPSFVDQQPLLQSISLYRGSNLYAYLAKAFPLLERRLDMTFQRYLVGGHNYWEGASIFWQIDTGGKIHAGKIMDYNASTGKRVKEPSNRITWYHCVANIENFNLVQCLFGEHLLNEYTSTVALVESEKTALILSLVATNILPLACGGCGNLTEKLNDSLSGHNVLVLPDKGQYHHWREKSTLLTKARSVFISSIMERSALEEGSDIADLILADPSQSNINKTIKNLFT